MPQGVTGCLARALAVVLVVSFVVALPLVIWFATLSEVVLSRATYLGALSGEGLYAALVPHLLPDMVDDAPGGETVADTEVTVADLFGNLGPDDWRAITTLVIPPEWLSQQVNRNVNALFDWLESDQVLPLVEIEMRPVKARLAGPEGREAANTVITSWAPCTAEEEAAMERFLDDAGPFVLCQPPGRMLAQVSARVAEPALARLAEVIPDGFALRGYVEAQPNTIEIVQDFNRVKYTANVLRRLAAVLYLVPAAVLALVVTVAVRNAKAFLGWMGVTLLAGGLAALIWPVILLLAGLGAFDPVRPEGANAMHEMGPLVRGAMQGLVVSLIGAYTRPMLGQAVVVIVTGFVALVAAVMLRSRGAVPAVGTGSVATATQLAAGTRPLPPTSQPAEPPDTPASQSG